jgi:hypothetical protein
MIIGQAAGVAAALAIRSHTAVQDIAVPDLQQKLREHGAILHLNEEFSAAKH